MINGPPEVMSNAIDRDENLIKVPSPVRVAIAFHAPLSDRLRKERTGPVPPKPHRFMRYVDAAFVEQIFDIPERKRKADVHHHRKADDLGRSFDVPKGLRIRKRYDFTPRRSSRV